MMTPEHGLHTLVMWADDQPVAQLGHAPLEDRWVLDYVPEWRQRPDAFPLSPALPLSAAEPSSSGAIKRFLENLLPEGRALDITAMTCRVSKANVFGLINALGTETTGAFRFLRPQDTPLEAETKPREVPMAELDARLASRDEMPFVVWDGKVRMSIAGYQDKLLVYQEQPGGALLLPEPPLASTHILKPEPERADMQALVVNEHYCMSLARRMGLPAAEVSLLRTPRPVLVVTRFDRQVEHNGDARRVRRLHIIDACQACDLPVSHKYERNLGNGEHVRNIREGVSFERLFRCVDLTIHKAAARRWMLQWALFQFLIGNSDAHGKNFSFFVGPQGLTPAPWYDLVSVAQYPGLDQTLAMAFGDAFTFAEVGAFPLADFAKRCGIGRGLLKREAARMSKLAATHSVLQAEVPDYIGEERALARRLRDFIGEQAARLDALATHAADIPDTYL